jgi:hypothetical protein
MIRFMNADEYEGLIIQKDVHDHTALSVTLKGAVSMEEFGLAENLK